ncbi:hypothetical protein [Paenibacillus sp. UNC451MF]|uniref:hypothetical protein n=1 Tax=Paenibacillus sp. UNC451MF TaxID=1449063 RepID=UPI00048F6285|nr:hypothetical protein [Paenibacillus sp. UNC451MF]
MVSKSSVTKAASAAAVMSVIAVPSVMAAPTAILNPIQDMTIAQGTEKTIYLNDYLSNLSSYKVTSQSVSGVVYATYSYSANNPLSLRGDQIGSSMVTISDASGKLEEFKVHVLDAGADKRIDIGDVTKYVAAHPADVTQAADVRTLLSGIEPISNSSTPVSPTPGVNGKPNAVVLAAGQTQAQTLPVASYFTKTAEETLSFKASSSYSYIEADIDQEGVLKLTGTATLGQYVGTTVEIQVTATNQYGKSATLNVPVTIQAVPMINGTPNPINWKLGLSEPQTVSMATYFSSESRLTYTINEDKLPSYINASIDKNEGILTINSVNPSSLPPTPPFIQVLATNSDKNSASIDIPVLIEYPTPGVTSTPSPIEWIIGATESKVLTISEFFHDTMEGASGLTYSIENLPPKITASINKDKLVIQGVQTTTDGSEVILVKATNKFGKSALLNVKVNVISSYTINWKKDDVQNYPNPYSVKLSTIFDGTGATDFELSSPPRESNVTVTIEGNQTDQAQLVFGGIIGDTEFTVVGRNPANGTSKEVKIRFVTDYAAPTITQEAEHVTVSNGREWGEGYPLVLNQYFSNPEGLQYSIVEDANISGEIFAELRGSGENTWIEFIGAYYPDNVTTSTIVKVKGTNMYGKSAVLEVPVTVEAAPAPEVRSVPVIEPLLDGVKTQFEVDFLSSYFTKDNLDLEVENSDELQNLYHARASMDGANLYFEIVSPIGNTQAVTFPVKVKAVDKFNQTAHLQIPVTVNPNSAPVLDADGIDTIYLDNRDGSNLIDLNLLGLFTDMDTDIGDKLNYSLEVTNSIQGGITSDHYMTLSGSSIDMGATVKVSAQDKAGHVISKTISVQNSPLGSSNVDFVNSNAVMTVMYPDTILPALPANTSDKSKAIYLVDMNNLNNLTYNAYHMSNDNYVNIMNGASLNYPATINLHYVNKVDHTLTLDVFPIIPTV